MVQFLGSILSRTMLLSIEVAVEYWLSLTWSPQAQWLSDSTHDSPLRDEVSNDSDLLTAARVSARILTVLNQAQWLYHLDS